MNQEKDIQKIIQGILNGSFLDKEWFRNQSKLLVMIVLLIIVYIYMGYAAQRQQRELNRLNMELFDARFRMLTIETELTTQTRQSAIYEELQNRQSELEINRQPVIKIK